MALIGINGALALLNLLLLEDIKVVRILLGDIISTLALLWRLLESFARVV
jgi:hypothetical protein